MKWLVLFHQSSLSTSDFEFDCMLREKIEAFSSILVGWSLVLALRLRWLTWDARVLRCTELTPGGVDSACHPSEVGKMSTSVLVIGALHQRHSHGHNQWCNQQALRLHMSVLVGWVHYFVCFLFERQSPTGHNFKRIFTKLHHLLEFVIGKKPIVWGQKINIGQRSTTLSIS